MSTSTRRTSHNGTLKQVAEVKRDLVSIKDDVRALGTDARKVGNSMVKDAGTLARRSVSKVGEQAKNAHGVLKEYTAAKPTKALLIALGVGALAGFWMRGSMRR